MQDKNKKIIIIALLIIGAFLFYLDNKPKGIAPTVIPDPIQKDLEEPLYVEITSRDNEKISVKLLAEYEISAKVLGVKKYYTDGAAKVSHRDFALGWGELGQPLYKKHVKYSQSGRWYRFVVDDIREVSVDYVSLHSANTHIVPANKHIWNLAKKVNKGDYVTLKGYLCSVEFPNGPPWTSSLTREDTGNGACEIMYVTDISW